MLNRDIRVKKNGEKAAEAARKAALLKAKADDYVSGIEAGSSRVDFDRLGTDRLLIVDAFNTWSGGALGEAAEVQFTYTGADPTCATYEELLDLLGRLRDPWLMYPVSGFLLAEEDESLKFRHFDAAYRLHRHTDGSRASAVNIAQARHIADVESAHKLWAFCAVEDCMAYLQNQLSIYSLSLEDEDEQATRRVFTSALQENFSIAQLWNAIWRCVKGAASLSKRQYWNSTKAARTIPKQIDKVLTEALNDPGFEHYRRHAETPAGAVLTLFRDRFGVADWTVGRRVREILAADAALAPPNGQRVDPAEDENDYQEHSLTQVSMHFLGEFTSLDRLVVECFFDVPPDGLEPTWDDAGELGCIEFTFGLHYCFDGSRFFDGVLKLLGVHAPTTNEVEQLAKTMPENKFASDRAFADLAIGTLTDAGVSPSAARGIVFAKRYPIEVDGLAAIVRGIAFPSGLVAIRCRHATIIDDMSIQDDRLSVGEYSFAFPQAAFEPEGDDRALVKAVVANQTEELSGMLARAVSASIRAQTDVEQSALLVQVANKLLQLARSPKSSEAPPPQPPASCASGGLN